MGVYAGIYYAQPGDVLVVATNAYKATAVMGDLMLRMAKNKGISCLVTDGLVRDSAGMVDVDLPVYCAGTTLGPPVRRGPCSVGLPIHIGGVLVRSGDLIIGDVDGIGVIPAEMIPKLVVNVPAQVQYENELERRIKDGLTLVDEVVEIIEKNTFVLR